MADGVRSGSGGSVSIFQVIDKPFSSSRGSMRYLSVARTSERSSSDW